MTSQQDAKSGPAPIGVIYDTSMSRADAALALAALHVSVSRREARVNAVSVNGSGFDAAIFCDLVARFYLGPGRSNSNNALPIGFAAETSTPANPPLVERAVKRTRADGQLQYPRTLQSISDSSAPDALLRNAVTLSVEAVVVLSAPAAWLARSLALTGTVARYRERVKRVVLVDAGDLERDPAALKSLTAALPAPPVTCGREIGEALKLPKTQLATAFTWSDANPIADAVSAAEGDVVALHDLAALHYALHPDAGFFSVSGGRLSIDSTKARDCREALVALATSKPAAPASGRGGG
ncbi:MAG TPA: hypothetical protein VGI12_15490 [Vicinamibacterales bacterium]